MKTSEILIESKALIENPENWIRGNYALPAKNSRVSMYGNDPEATCFCSIGALQRINNTIGHDVNGSSYLCRVAGDMYHTGITDANDRYTHQEVMALWDEAIRRAKADEDKLRSE